MGWSKKLFPRSWLFCSDCPHPTCVPYSVWERVRDLSPALCPHLCPWRSQEDCLSSGVEGRVGDLHPGLHAVTAEDGYWLKTHRYFHALLKLYLLGLIIKSSLLLQLTLLQIPCNNSGEIWLAASTGYLHFRICCFFLSVVLAIRPQGNVVRWKFRFTCSCASLLLNKVICLWSAS